MSEPHHCPSCGTITDGAVCPACWSLIQPKLETPFTLKPVISTPSANVPASFTYHASGPLTIICDGKTLELENVSVKLPHPLLPFPHQLDIMNGMDAFKSRLWERNLKSGEAAG